MSRTYHHGKANGWQRHDGIPRPRRWHEWQRLLRIAPHLKAMLPFTTNEPVPPYPTANAAFLALAACFADPGRREALRALILDVLGNDLKDLFLAHCERMHSCKPAQHKSRT